MIESWMVCQENFLKKDLHQEEKIIYVVTPTYVRFEQVVDLARLLYVSRLGIRLGIQIITYLQQLDKS